MRREDHIHIKSCFMSCNDLEGGITAATCLLKKTSMTVYLILILE